MPTSVFPSVITLTDESAMVEFGERLGFYLQENQLRCLFLEGELGAGKTTLVRGILRSFGHSGSVKSPTYTLVEVYEFERVRVNHFDLYRLKDPEELEYMGIRDYFTARDFCFVEWPNKGAGYLPEPDCRLTIEVLPVGRRLVFQTRSLIA